MKQQKFTGVTGFTMDDTVYQYETVDKTPKDAPNVVYIVLDDLGFSQLGCYGSTINTPNLDRIAAEGLRYNNFHTTAICSATRASLLTGMNHHTAGICGVVEMMTGCDNGIGHVHKDCATLAEILKEYDYGTYATGKWHLTDVSETTAAGPFDNWPLGRGFDKYYGFLHAQMDQFHPRLVNDNTLVDQPKTPEEGYHFSEDITDHAIKYIYHQHIAYPEKPFFLYLAFGAMHTPHHAPKEYIDKYKGKFDAGWDKIREQWYERQKELGIIPADTKLTDRNEFVQPWDSLSEKQKKVYARFMEAFAGMLEHTDAQIGRLIDYLQQIGQLDNTVIVFLSDNGASAEGGVTGTINNFYKPSSTREEDGDNDIDYLYEHIDEIGTQAAFNHYPQGWANAGNAPFPWYKIWTYSGGVKDAMIVRYPKLIHDPGSIRNQYHHVSDVTPTILDIIGVQKPESIKGIHQRPFQGISFKYTLSDPTAPDRKHVQYFEMLGNRAIYKDGWKAVVNHFRNGADGDFAGDVWELYHVAEDFSESTDVADQYPEKVAELERTWMIEAAKAGVFPMFNGTMYGSRAEKIRLNKNTRTYERFGTFEDILEPTDIIQGLTSAINTNSHVIRAVITRQTAADQGVLFSAGNRFSGFTLYVKDNHLQYTYNNGGRYFHTTRSEHELPVGTVEIEYRLKIKKDLHAIAELFINNSKEATLNIPEINGMVDFISTIGGNRYTSVAPEEYDIPFDFSGHIDKISLFVDGSQTTTEEELDAFFAAD